MINFFKDSLRELKHVVWPTREETRNYFFIVVITLILFGLYLFAVSTVFTEALFALKDAVGGTSTTETTIDPSAFIDTLETPTVEVSGVEVSTDNSDIAEVEGGLDTEVEGIVVDNEVAQ
ncbi:preprotein translocase subunit SecE [Candidatus Gracilibacteria bacterium]|nr:preprotein translocase subunit SecE [Candidatus Gracilibacteria bacterium]